MSRTLLSLGGAALALALTMQRAAAETFVVATNGNDAAAGTEAAPWKTLQKAANTVKAGDTVKVKPGSYKGFQLTKSGREGAEIVFIADGDARITSNNPSTADGINLEGASFVRIERFTITGTGRAGIRAVGNEDAHCKKVTIRGNRSDSNGNWGIFTGFCDDLLIENNETSRSRREHGIYTSNSGDRPVIRNNISWGNNAAGIHMNGDGSEGGDGVISGALVENNVIFQNGVAGGSAINCDGVKDSVLRNNLMFDNRASGISLFQVDGSLPSTGNLVINNTIVMAANGRWALNIKDGSTGNRIHNNILLHRGTRGAIDISADSVPGTVSNNNVVTNRFSLDDRFVDLAAWRAATQQDAASVASTPAQLFVNGTGTKPADYVLKAGSPALDKGTATGAPNTDLAGNPRPQGPGIDVGAFELCTGQCNSPPNPTPASAGGSSGGGSAEGESGGGGEEEGESSRDPGADLGADQPEVESGGCQTSGGSSGMMLVLMMAAGTVVMRRRRR